MYMYIFTNESVTSPRVMCGKDAEDSDDLADANETKKHLMEEHQVMTICSVSARILHTNPVLRKRWKLTCLGPGAWCSIKRAMNSRKRAIYSCQVPWFPASRASSRQKIEFPPKEHFI